MKILQDMSILLVLLMTSTLSLDATMAQKQTTDDLMSENARARGTVKMLTTQNISTMKAVEALKTQNASIMKAVRALKAQNERLSWEKMDLVKKMIILKEEIGPLRNSLEEAQKIIKSLQKELTTARSKLRNPSRLSRQPSVLRKENAPIEPRML